MKALCFTFLMLFNFLALFSQSSPNNHNVAEDSSNGKLIINQDDRLDDLLHRHIEINKKTQGIPGFRIRIFSQSGQSARINAIDVQAKFFSRYPDISTYLDYDPPNFKVYAGDFRTRSEALRMQREIRRDYPNSFIISTLINFPSLD
jgi:hypothetical protein